MNRTHGHSRRAPEYCVWATMLQRCLNPKSSQYERYGGRGITVCASWRSYENFIADMGRRPSALHSIDRKDNDGNYEPCNCRWATKREQARNRRDVAKFEYKGEHLSVAELAERSGLGAATLQARIKSGWPIVAAVEKPARHLTRAE